MDDLGRGNTHTHTHTHTSDLGSDERTYNGPDNGLMLRRDLDAEARTLTLKELQLAPSATILVLPQV